MHPDLLATKIYYALNEELLRRMLVKYFKDKGIEDFNSKIYPPSIQDIVVQIPQLSTKLEVVPFVEDIDPASGMVVLGWNLFALGNQRMYLGESVHSSLSEIQVTQSIITSAPSIKTLGYATPKKISNFIIEILGRNKSFDLTKCPKTVRPMIPGMAAGLAGDSSGYFRNRPVF